MNPLLKIFILCCICAPIWAQVSTEQLPIAVISSPENLELNAKQAKLLKNKTKQIVTRNGLAATGSHQFAIYADLQLLSETEAELLVSLTEIEAEVTFTIIQNDNNIIFGSTAVEVSGHGDNKQAAIMSAIRDLNPRSIEIVQFIDHTKKKMQVYYEQQCTMIIEDASKLAVMKQYEASIALLFSIPSTVSCHSIARSRAMEVYNNYQNQKCREWTQLGRAYLENNQHDAALEVLAKVDPLSDCGVEVSSMLSQAGVEVDAKEEKYWTELQRRYDNKIDLSKMRITAMRDIMVAYHQQSDTNLWLIR